MGWLATFFGGIYYVSSGPKAPAAAATAPPINAGSSDEADFIKCDISLYVPRKDTILLTTRQEVHGAGREEELNAALLGGTLYDAMYI